MKKQISIEKIEHIANQHKCYFPLFKHMADEYDLCLTESECDEIIGICQKVVEAINKLNK